MTNHSRRFLRLTKYRWRIELTPIALLLLFDVRMIPATSFLQAQILVEGSERVDGVSCSGLLHWGRAQIHQALTTAGDIDVVEAPAIKNYTTKVLDCLGKTTVKA